MKIDSIDKVTSFDSPVSEPLGNEDKSIMTTKKSSLSDLNYTPYKPVNITGQAKKAYNHYLNRGVKPNVAAGIVGNLYKESGLNPTAVGDKGTAFGVAQWRGDRLSNLKKYASSRGRNHTDLNTQLDFILDEQGENQVLNLMGNQSPEQAAKTFADKYERPNPQYADYSTRSSVAKQLGKMKLGGFIPQLKKGGLIGTQKVADYQKMLNEKYGAGLTEDGVWGNKTEEAYKKYVLNVDSNIPISRTQNNNKGNYNINTNTGDTLFVDKPKANTMIRYDKPSPSVLDNVKVGIKAKDLLKELETRETTRPVPLGKKIDYLGVDPVKDLKQIKPDTETYLETRPKKIVPAPINKPVSSSSTVVNKPTINEYNKKLINPKVDNSPKSPSFIDKAILAIQNPQSTWDNIINQFDKGNEKSNIKSKGITLKENKPIVKGKPTTRPSFMYDYESTQKTPYRTKNSYHAPFTMDLSNNNKRFDLVDASTFEKAKKHPELKNSKGIVINTFNEFGDVNDNNADVIQLKSDGSIDVGKRGSFKEGKFSKLNKIPLDLSDVDYIYDKDDKNYKIYSKKTKSEIPIYTSQKRNNLDEATDYGKYLGGKHILVSGKKKVLVNGSAKDFKDIADKLTKETGEPVSLYQLDNGAYNLPFMKSDNKLTREDIISHRNRHLTSGGVGLSLRAYKFGGVIPKHALGAGEIMGLVSQGLNLGAGLIDSTNDQENPNVAKSAISGFIKGNAALPGIGGILGGIAGIRDAKKQRELFQKKKDIQNREVVDYFNIRSKGILDNYNTQGTESSFYAKGGIPNPQYEVEHGEVIIGDDVKLTGGKQLASNLHKVVGKTHDQFNPNTVNGTGEDGQGGQFIFSNRLKLGGKTFAKLAEGVAKQKAKAEEMMSHNDYIFKNTGQANAEIADAKLMQLAQIQEMMKGETNPLGQFKFGGKVSKYPEGKNLTEDKGIVEGRNFLTNWYKKRNLVTKPIDISKSLDYVKDDLPGFVKADGLYNPINNKAHFNETKPVTASLATHEFTHAIDDKYGDNINFKDSPYEYNKKVLKTDYTSLGVKPIEGSLNTYGNLTYDYVTKPEETYARLNELRQSSGHEPNKVVTTDDIKKLKRNNDLFMFYSDEDIMKMWNGLSSKNRKSSFPNQLNSGLRKAKFGGSIPQYVGGGELTAEQAYEQAYKNLERAAKARATKAANSAAKKAADVAYEAAYKAEQELAKKVGESVVKKTAERLTGSTLMKGLGIVGRLATAAQVYGTAGVMTYAGMKDAEKRGGFSTPQMGYKIPDKSNASKLDKVNPNELTIPERRALRNSIPTANPSAPTTPQGTNKPSGNRLKLNTSKTKPVVDNTVRNQFNTLNPLTNKQIDNSVKLPNIINKVDASKVISPISKDNVSVESNENFSPVIGAALSGINYFANQNMINKYKTQTPATLLQNPNYQYFDRSGNARASVRGITNSIMNNPFLNQGTKQVALANSMNVINDVNQQELNRKQEYDRSYRGQQIETENRNAMILNQARQQTMQNENQKQGLRQDNLNNLFGNINTNLSEVQANKQQDKAMQYMSLPYFKRVGLLTPEQQAQFKKNPISFLMGESEVPKNKKGGRIKMKYC